MVSKVFSCSLIGLNCNLIEVEAHISNGMPSFSIVGMGDTSVQESKERVRSSIKNSGATFPNNRKIINLAPAQLKKQGAIFDLPVAISILLATQQISPGIFQKSIVVGELSLEGKVKRINGILAITQFAKEKGFERIFIPEENSKEASFINGIKIFPVSGLDKLISFAKGEFDFQPVSHSQIYHERRRGNFSLSNIIGQQKAKRSLAIAAAGGHNVLFQGSPGCGKTMLLRNFQFLLPQMNREETLETTKIYSVSGMIDPESPLIINRPFREVHHTASAISIIGGGSIPRPGEITLAHNGVLFFDEIGEFSPQVLNALRQPLQDRKITINRAAISLKYPSNFIFLAAMNPCPCGYRNDKKISCICTEGQIRSYLKRLSGPLLDRFDIFMEISKVPMEKIVKKQSDNKSDILIKIERARKMQERRFKDSKITKNSDMDLREVQKYCKLGAESENLLTMAANRLNLSTRGYFKTLKIARTIADLESSDKIETRHVAEAIQYRNKAG